MTQVRYYRLAMFVPIVLPAIGWLILFTDSGASNQQPVNSTLLFGLVAWLWLVTMGAVFYGLPYLVAVGILWRRSRTWPPARLRRWVWILPTLFVIAGGVVVAGTNLVFTHDPNWFDYVRETIRGSAAVGYGEALLIWLGERMGAQFGWLTPHAGTV